MYTKNMLPLKLYSPFLIEIAKETKMYWTPNLTPALASSSYHQSETRRQWSSLQGRWIWDVEWLIWEDSITCNSSTFLIRWLRRSGALAYAWEVLNFLFSVSSLFSNIISWNLRDTNRRSENMDFASDYGLCTNRIFSLHYLKSTWNLYLCP